MTSRLFSRISVFAAGAVVLVFLHLLSSGAGFGFDPCDYYIGAEDWLSGLKPYGDFFFSKTPGILFLTAAFFKLTGGHAFWLAWHTTWVNAAWAAAAAWAMAPLLGRRLAAWVFPVSLAAGLCCMINFWNAEQPMTLMSMLGIGAWLRRGRAERPSVMLLAGLCLGAAVLFKLFAVLSAGSILALTWIGSRRLGERLRGLLWMALGWAIPLGLTAAWAARNGVLGPMWEQSVVTPLFYYASHQAYLADFLARAGWIVLLGGAGLTAAVCHGWRDARRGEPSAGFVLGVLGLPYLLTLVKNQAAHYLIPFLPFAAAWALIQIRFAMERLTSSRRSWLLGVAAAAFVLLAGAVVFYKRASFERVLFRRAMDQQRKDCAELAQWVGEGERVLFINAGPYPHLSLYWASGERPYPWPFIAVVGFQRRAIERFGFENFLRVCSDRHTRIVAVDFNSPMEATLPWPYQPEEMERLKKMVEARFEPLPGYPGVYLRRGSGVQNAVFRRGPYRGEPLVR